MKYFSITHMFLALSLVSCKPNSIRESQGIRYKVETVANKSFDVTIRIYNLNDFDWFIPVNILYPERMSYEILKDGRPWDFIGAFDTRNSIGIYEKVAASKYFESIFYTGNYYKTSRNDIKNGPARFVWSTSMEVFKEKPSIKYGEKSSSEIESRVVTLGGRVLLN